MARGIIGKAMRGAAAVGVPAALEVHRSRIMAQLDARRHGQDMEKMAGQHAYQTSERIAGQEFTAGQGDLDRQFRAEADQQKHEADLAKEERGHERAKELVDYKSTYQEPSLQEIHDPDSPTGSRFVPKNQAIGQPGKGQSPTANRKKYEELIDMGVPEEAARGTAYGLYQEVKDMRGNPMLINLEDGGLVGSMVRDPKTGQYSWQTNTRKADANAEAVYEDVPPNPNHREAGKVYKTPTGLHKWMGEGWLKQ